MHIFNRFHRQDVQCDNPAIECARSSPFGSQLAAQILAPRTRCRAKFYHRLPRAYQAQRLINLFELVGGAGAVSFALSQLYIRVVNMVVKPSPVDFFTFGFYFLFLLNFS